MWKRLREKNLRPVRVAFCPQIPYAFENATYEIGIQ